jgi:Na+-transporting NADH:ubiquinone oxidoreductase subunit NqrB
VTVMLGNAALFVFGAIQHAGLSVGSFHEPRIIPAAIVESICALSLAAGAGAILTRQTRAWLLAVVGNAIALAGVVLGIVALALGAGPRTASNDSYHRVMLVLITIALLGLFFRRRSAGLQRS